MKTPTPPTAGDLAAMEAALATTSVRLHGIASRTSGAHIAAEVLRLNDAVRSGAAGRISSGDQPADFGALLLASADPCNDREKP
jgi:hypothetical protein